ncbi:MAG: 1-(5-phosphoribosyl)-5-[(5-phosphoribosylamino)methylideneamino]imidazole-4-carboxamide isomerase [Nitrosomonadaceae bacterium]|nr:1-(5-phosphoribosyl)-5-[(5-phosphoribosylamino)methylideneamino]imidazole-4-carboxamide isomerase [Nitrosomonadaceae bacterium]|tara:strand:- start:253 stop:999 length:747 start_codon:yes stop_codon:yes gene_type:complete
MLIIPAIDLKDGNCVRLKQGVMESATVFSRDPVAMAQYWLGQGAQRLHLVDLNGAFAGKPTNTAVIRDIIGAIDGKIPIQLGGGIRDLDTIRNYLEEGISYIIIGTAAVSTPSFLHQACNEFPGQIMVGLDAKNGKIAVDGWSKITDHNVIDLAKKFEAYGVVAIIYTDISRDGMLNGINIKATVKLARELTIPVIASGGVTSLEDVSKLCEVEAKGIIGVITGRAIYEGTLDFRESQVLADEFSMKA